MIEYFLVFPLANESLSVKHRDIEYIRLLSPKKHILELASSDKDLTTIALNFSFIIGLLKYLELINSIPVSSHCEAK